MDTQVSPVRVLLVDDDPQEFQLMKTTMGRIGAESYRLDWASDYEAGIAALRRKQHDVCLLDYLLGPRTGLELLSEARNEGCEVPIVIITGVGSELVELAALSAGASDYLVKGLLDTQAFARTLMHVIERNRAFEELRKRDLLYRAVFAEALDAILIADDRGAFIDANRAACLLTGLSYEELMKLHVHDIATPSEGKDITSAWDEFLRVGWETGEFRIVRPDGDERIVEFNAIANIAPGHNVSFLRDVTERRRSELVRTRLAAIVESSDDAIIGMDLDGTVISWNKGAQKLYGYTPEEAIGQPLSMALPPERTQELTEIMARIRRGESVDHCETIGLRKDGTLTELSITVSPVRNAAGQITGASVVKRDLTERRRTEAALQKSQEQLHRAQKMEAIGALAGGIAHDFNNLLSVILSYSRFILDGLGPQDPLRLEIEQINQAGERAARLTKQLLAFSRRQVLAPRTIELNQTVVNMQHMLKHLVGEHISLSLVTSAELPKVFADPNQLEQVIMNLVLNARDAMPTGGRLCIETANVELEDIPSVGHVGAVSGSYVMLSVTDTGVGMDAATRDRIFEPFFTTKGPGKGTGLGLPTVLGIVQQSGGHLVVQSEVGIGTTLRVYLPQSTESVMQEAPHPTMSTVRGSETILLVEDEDSVRMLVHTILDRNGYHVLEAQNGGEALLICEQHTADIDLLLTDVVMPRMSGVQLAQRLAPLRPAMKLCFMSGYTDDTIVHHGVADAEVALIHKPLTPEALLKQVREVLDTPLTHRKFLAG